MSVFKWFHISIFGLNILHITYLSFPTNIHNINLINFNRILQIIDLILYLIFHPSISNVNYSENIYWILKISY